MNQLPRINCTLIQHTGLDCQHTNMDRTGFIAVRPLLAEDPSPGSASLAPRRARCLVCALVRPAVREERVELPDPGASEARLNGLPCIFLKAACWSAVRTSEICLLAAVRILSMALRIFSNWARNSSFPGPGRPPPGGPPPWKPPSPGGPPPGGHSWRAAACKSAFTGRAATRKTPFAGGPPPGGPPPANPPSPGGPPPGKPTPPGGPPPGPCPCPTPPGGPPPGTCAPSSPGGPPGPPPPGPRKPSRRRRHGRPLVLAHLIDDRLDLLGLIRGQLELLRDIRPGHREDSLSLELDLAQPRLLLGLEDLGDRLLLLFSQRVHRFPHLPATRVRLPTSRERLPALLSHRCLELLELALLFVRQGKFSLDGGKHEQGRTAGATRATRTARAAGTARTAGRALGMAGRRQDRQHQAGSQSKGKFLRTWATSRCWSSSHGRWHGGESH